MGILINFPVQVLPLFSLKKERKKEKECKLLFLTRLLTSIQTFCRTDLKSLHTYTDSYI